MPADYDQYKTVLNDPAYATKINNFMGAVETDMNSKQGAVELWARSVLTKTSNYTVAVTDYTINIDCTVANVTITLPAAASFSGRVLVFRRKDASGYVASVGTVCTLDLQGEAVTLQSDGVVWVRVG